MRTFLRSPLRRPAWRAFGPAEHQEGPSKRPASAQRAPSERPASAQRAPRKTPGSLQEDPRKPPVSLLGKPSGLQNTSQGPVRSTMGSKPSQGLEMLAVPLKVFKCCSWIACTMQHVCSPQRRQGSTSIWCRIFLNTDNTATTPMVLKVVPQNCGGASTSSKSCHVVLCIERLLPLHFANCLGLI